MKTHAKYNGMTGYIDGYFAGNGVACAAFVADGVIHIAPVGRIEVITCEPEPTYLGTQSHSLREAAELKKSLLEKSKKQKKQNSASTTEQQKQED